MVAKRCEIIKVTLRSDVLTSILGGPREERVCGAVSRMTISCQASAFEQETDERSLFQQGERGFRLSSFSASRTTHIRASAAGHVFGLWRQDVSPAGFQTISLNGSDAFAKYEHTSVGFIRPSGDGAAVCSHAGVYAPDLKTVRHRGIYIPTAHPTVHLRVQKDADKLDIRDMKKGKSLLAMGTVDVKGTKPSFGSKTLTWDQRFHCVPQAKVLVSIPDSDDKLLVRQLDIDVPALPINQAAYSPRVWTDKTGNYKVQATLVSAVGGKVKLKKSDGSVIEVGVQILSEKDVEFLKSIQNGNQ